MTEEKCPYMAGCVFYLLLRKAAYTGATARQHRDGIKDDHKNPIFMSDLVYTFTGTQTNISPSDISQYREGTFEGGSYLPFNDPSDIASYDYVVRNRYPDALKRMREFAQWHLNPDKREWMVKACLELIENDNDILETDELCIKGDGEFVSKEKIRRERVYPQSPPRSRRKSMRWLNRSDATDARRSQRPVRKYRTQMNTRQMTQPRRAQKQPLFSSRRMSSKTGKTMST